MIKNVISRWPSSSSSVALLFCVLVLQVRQGQPTGLIAALPGPCRRSSFTVHIKPNLIPKRYPF